MRWLFLRLFAAIGFLAAARAGHAEAPPTGRLPDGATPLSYALHLTVDPQADGFSGSARIRVRLTGASDHVWLHARELDVDRAQWFDAAGRAHAATFALRAPSGVAEVGLGETLPPQEIDLAFDYHASFNRKLQGAYKVLVGADPYVVTQFEAISARYAFPGFDEPRFKTPFELTLTVPPDEVAIANTRAAAETRSGDGRWKTIAFARTQPLPTYLVAFAVGQWDVVDAPPMPVNAVRRQPLPLRGVGPKGTGAQMKWILAQAPAIVKFFEEYTKQPFPFDKLDLVGAPDFAAGAMENAGLIVFRDALLRIDASSPAGQTRSGFDVTAHEIAHQWFGDLVTVPWWNDIWLNEAFASWGQGMASSALKPEFLADLGRLEGALGAMDNDSLLSARKIRQEVDDQGEIENAFDSITYRKGAAVLRMFEEWVGADTYRRAMQTYLARHAYGSGNSDDLVAAIADVSGKGAALAQSMRGFLDQPGIPLLHVSTTCTSGKATLAVAQSRYLPFGVLSGDNLRWSVPLCARLGRGESSSRQCFLADRPQQTFAIDGACPDWVLPNADASGYYRFTLGASDFAALEQHLGALAPAEQMIVADAIRSAFAAGDLGAGALLDALPAFASSEYPQVALALSGELHWMREHLADDATRPLLDAYAARLYAPRLAQLGFRHRPGEADAQARLRQRIASFLALEMRDPATRRELNAQGRAALGLDGGGAVDLARVDPDLRGFALKVAVQDSGKAAFDAALAALQASSATQERYELVAALGSTRDPQLAERARALGLTPAIAVGELSRLYGAHVAEAENRDGFWLWYRAHFDALRARYPDAYQRSLARLPATGGCARPRADELQQWFAPRVAGIIGGRRALAQSLETVTQCAALRSHLGDNALATWAESHAR